MKCLIVVLLVFACALALPKPQLERGAITAPSGRFPFTRQQASPPVDLSRPPVLLPIATPIHEAPQELVAADTNVAYSLF